MIEDSPEVESSEDSPEVASSENGAGCGEKMNQMKETLEQLKSLAGDMVDLIAGLDMSGPEDPGIREEVIESEENEDENEDESEDESVVNIDMR